MADRATRDGKTDGFRGAAEEVKNVSWHIASETRSAAAHLQAFPHIAESTRDINAINLNSTLPDGPQCSVIQTIKHPVLIIYGFAFVLLPLGTLFGFYRVL